VDPLLNKQSYEEKAKDFGRYAHGGNIYSAMEQMDRMTDSVELIDFSANINPLGLPEGVKEAIRNSVDQFGIYPDPYCRKLTSALSQREGVPEEWILCGNGAADLIYRCVYALKPRKAVVLAPTFAEYEEALNMVSCQVVHYELQEKTGFQVEDGLLEILEEDLDIVFLCNPNNPTGQLIPKEFLSAVLQRCKVLGIQLFVDECFNEFLDDPARYSVKEYLEEYDNLIILKAFTKIYAMAGIRLGHCIASNLALIKGIADTGQPWSVSAPAQIAGVRALEEQEYLTAARELIQQEREYLVSALRELGIAVISANANYIFMKSPELEPEPLHERLFKKGILIRNCENYHGLGPGYYRICIKQHGENVTLISALRAIVC
jgi:threonine-phosphate decarboxylase